MLVARGGAEVAITKLTVENFKSFDKLEVELRPFNVVVGSNASGKSNFLDVFRFLRDIEATSLESAIGIRGGPEILRNFNLGDNQVLHIRVEVNDSQRNLVFVQGEMAIGMKTHRTTYELAVQFDKSDAGYEVVTDRLTEHFEILELNPAADKDGLQSARWFPPVWSASVWQSGNYVEQQILGSARTVYRREGAAIKCCFDLPEGLPFAEEGISTLHGASMPLHRPDEVMLERFPRQAFLPGMARTLGHISTYDFDPRKAQQAVPPTGSRELDTSAENLSVVLREILRRPDSKNRLINLLSALLPFVHDLGVEEFGFGQLITTLTERFSDEGHRLPAAFASDGTIACLALVVALYFQESSVAIFEEPDRHVHPHLASRVMQMMNEVTDTTQVIVTTHNPELLRHANLEDILLVTRGSDGNSEVTRPADSEVVRQFLQSELGVEDLFAQNLLSL